MPFSKLGLCDPITKAITELGYKTPTSIQQKAIPVILAGKNLVAEAQTGTGKTAAFVLPILQKLMEPNGQKTKKIRALILTPTRELAIQVEANIRGYSKHLRIFSMAVYGGVNIEPQIENLSRGIDILVATPGRLIDLYKKGVIDLASLEILVLDEADRMLDMGFVADINKIIEALPKKRQNLLFSATIDASVRTLAKTAIKKATEIKIESDSIATPKIKQWLVTVDRERKSALLRFLIKQKEWKQALIFIETIRGAEKLVAQLEKRGVKAQTIHGGRSQTVRAKLLNDFKLGKINFLIATGIATRGLDIADLDLVINYGLPDDPDDYIHRIGRTGRAGSAGEAVSFVSIEEYKNLCNIETLMGRTIKRKAYKEFPVKVEVPSSNVCYIPKK